MCIQHARRSRTVMRSGPGDVLTTLITLFSVSSIDKCVSQCSVVSVAGLRCKNSSMSNGRSSSAEKRVRIAVRSTSAFSVVSVIVRSLTTRGGSWLLGSHLCQAMTLKRAVSSFALSSTCCQNATFAFRTVALRLCSASRLDSVLSWLRRARTCVLCACRHSSVYQGALCFSPRAGLPAT